MAEILEFKDKEPALDEDKELDSKKIIPVIDDIIKQYEGKRGALIPVLQSVQNFLGYLPQDILVHISEQMRIPYSEITGVVTFYSFFSTVPKGQYMVRVCLGTACYVRGGKEVLEAISRELNIKVGQTTEDKVFSLEIGRCFGACGLAPVVMINDEVHQRVKPNKIHELLEPYRTEAERKEGGPDEN